MLAVRVTQKIVYMKVEMGKKRNMGIKLIRGLQSVLYKSRVAFIYEAAALFIQSQVT